MVVDDHRMMSSFGADSSTSLPMHIQKITPKFTADRDIVGLSRFSVPVSRNATDPVLSHMFGQFAINDQEMKVAKDLKSLFVAVPLPNCL